MGYFNDFRLFFGGYLIGTLIKRYEKEKDKHLYSGKRKNKNSNLKSINIITNNYKNKNGIKKVTCYNNRSNIINDSLSKIKISNNEYNFLKYDCNINYLWKIIDNKVDIENNFVKKTLLNVLLGSYNLQDLIKYSYKKKKIRELESEYNLLPKYLFKKVEINKFDLIKEDLLDNIDLMIIGCLNFRSMVNLLSKEKLDDELKYISKQLMNKLSNNGIKLMEHKLNEIIFNIYKSNIVSCEIYKLWLKENNVCDNISSICSYLDKENINNKFLYNNVKMRLLHGYLIYNRLKNNNLNLSDFELLIKDLNEFVTHSNKKISEEYKFIVGIIMLNLTEEFYLKEEKVENKSKLLLLLLKLNLDHFLTTLILINIVESIGNCVLNPENHKILTELEKVLSFYLNNKRYNIQEESEDISKFISDLQNDLVNSLIEKNLINIQIAKRIIEFKFEEIRNEIFSTYNNRLNIKPDLLSCELLFKILNYFNDEYSRSIIMDHFFNDLNFILKTMEEIEKKGFVLNSEYRKINFVGNHFNINLEKFKLINQASIVKLYSKLNNKINKLYFLYDDKNFDYCLEDKIFKLISYYNVFNLVQRNIEENLLKNDCNWTLIYEGLKLLNNCLLIISNKKKYFNIDEIIKFTDEVLNNLKQRFEKISNSQELKLSIPQSKIYFELIRLIHNLQYISNNNDGIGFLSQGLIPLSVARTNSYKNNSRDFLYNYINDCFKKKKIKREFESKKVNEDEYCSTNVIFIHGFLGSAFKSWNLDLSKNCKVPKIIENNFNFRELTEQTLQKGLGVDFQFSIEPKNNNLIPILEKRNYLIWPRILLDNHPGLRLIAIDYSHQIFNNDNSLTLNEISQEIYKKLLKANIFSHSSISNNRNNVIICHSMGGILLKTMISNHPEIIKNIKGIIFFGTPHFGTSLHSSIIHLFRKKISPYIIELSSSLNIKQLKKLNMNFQKIIYSMPKKERPTIYSFSEYLPSKIPFLFNINKIIVPHFNSNPFIGNFCVLNTDHSNINKLTLHDNDIRYLSVKHLINL